jgi:hypothetical protein
MAGAMRQRHEHFLLASGHAIHIFAHDGVAAGVAMFVTQSFADAYRRVALFYGHLPVSFQDGIDDASKRRQRGRDG